MKTFGILLLNLLLLTSCTNTKNTVKENKPNFLFIITDDQTYESIHSINNPEIKTPTMDKLASEGVIFSHCFNQGSWSGAVCLASRSMLITGQNVFRAAQNHAYIDKWGQIDVKEKTEVSLWPEVFGKAGYQTFLTGKWHNSEYAALKSFDYASAIGEGMYETRDSSGSKEPGYNRPTVENNNWSPWDTAFTGNWLPIVKDIFYTEDGTKEIGEPYKVHQHTSELYANRAIDFIQSKAQNSDHPFFMYVAFNAPHDPRQSPKEFVDMYPHEAIGIPENYVPLHPFDQGDRKVRDEQLAPFPRTHEAVKTHRSEYYAIISHADREIGRILEALEESGKAENTYVILTSDHGLAVGMHGLMGKQSQYDHSIRMPLIITGPGIKKGSKVDKLVYMQSMFATTCNFAGIEVPETVDFESIAGLATGNSSEGGEDYVFGAYKKLQRMVRTEKYKLIYYPHIDKTQLFDVENDPYEMEDLSEVISLAEVKKELQNKMLLKQKELGDDLLSK